MIEKSCSKAGFPSKTRIPKDVQDRMSSSESLLFFRRFIYLKSIATGRREERELSSADSFPSGWVRLKSGVRGSQILGPPPTAFTGVLVGGRETGVGPGSE